MTENTNVPQEVVDDLLTDPDADADRSPPPASPQTVANEPSADRPKPSRG